MARQKVLVVLGTRPEAIKLAPVILEARRHDQVDCRVCLTGQHREMVEQVHTFYGIEPDYDLDIMRPRQSLTDVTTACLNGLRFVLAKENPDWVIVQGDTTTTFAAALAAFYHGVKVAHVEAGLRTWNLASPFPEEANRVLTGRLASLHLAATEPARDNLLREGIHADDIMVVGNPGIDALKSACQLIQDRNLGLEYQEVVPGLDLDKPLVLVTGHRRESFGAPFERLCAALRELAEETDAHFVYPVHLNPNVRRPVSRILEGLSNFHLIEPVSYPVMVWLMSQSRFLITDSGGLQEEAPSLGKPVLVLRETTERQESVNAGVAKLVGTDPKAIVAEGRKLLVDGQHYAAMARPLDLYGDGQASGRIVDGLLGWSQSRLEHSKVATGAS